MLIFKILAACHDETKVGCTWKGRLLGLRPRQARSWRSPSLSQPKELGRKFKKIPASKVMQTTILERDQALGQVRRKQAVGAQEKESKFDRANCCKRQFSSTINPLDGWSKHGARRVIGHSYKCWSKGGSVFLMSRQIGRRTA